MAALHCTTCGAPVVRAVFPFAFGYVVGGFCADCRALTKESGTFASQDYAWQVFAQRQEGVAA